MAVEQDPVHIEDHACEHGYLSVLTSPLGAWRFRRRCGLKTVAPPVSCVSPSLVYRCGAKSPGFFDFLTCKQMVPVLAMPLDSWPVCLRKAIVFLRADINEVFADRIREHPTGQAREHIETKVRRERGG